MHRQIVYIATLHAYEASICSSPVLLCVCAVFVATEWTASLLHKKTATYFSRHVLSLLTCIHVYCLVLQIEEILRNRLGTMQIFDDNAIAVAARKVGC
jgi:hypothetical protein